MKYLLLPLISVTAVLGTACKHESAGPLPPATQEGKNTMGCIVDGLAWTPSSSNTLGSGGQGNPFVVRWRRTYRGYSLNMFFSSATGQAQVPTGFYFWVPDVRRPMVVTLDQTANPMLVEDNPAYAECAMSKHTPQLSLLTGPDAVGELRFTRFDTVARVVAGTFQFTGRDRATGRTVHITDGRFDMRLP